MFAAVAQSSRSSYASAARSRGYMSLHSINTCIICLHRLASFSGTDVSNTLERLSFRAALGKVSAVKVLNVVTAALLYHAAVTDHIAYTW